MPPEEEDIGAKINAALGPVTQNLEEIKADNQRLRGMVEGLAAAPSAPAPPAGKPDAAPITRAQLTQQVQAGDLTQEQADQIWERGFEERISGTIVETVQETTKEASRVQLVQAEIDRYTAAVPDIMKDGSDIRATITSAYNEQVAKFSQDPKRPETELMAIRTILGPIERLEKARGADLQPDTHHDTYATGGGRDDHDDGDEPRQDGTPKGMTGDERRYYKDAIQKGIYADWDAVAADMKHADPRVRQRHGAKAA